VLGGVQQHAPDEQRVGASLILDNLAFLVSSSFFIVIVRVRPVVFAPIGVNLVRESNDVESTSHRQALSKFDQHAHVLIEPLELVLATPCEDTTRGQASEPSLGDRLRSHTLISGHEQPKVTAHSANNLLAPRLYRRHSQLGGSRLLQASWFLSARPTQLVMRCARRDPQGALGCARHLMKKIPVARAQGRIQCVQRLRVDFFIGTVEFPGFKHERDGESRGMLGGALSEPE
jgi:hypothetical protein